MKEFLTRFIQEEDGNVVQTVIIIAIFAALALLLGKTIREFVEGFLADLGKTGKETSSLTEQIRG